MDVDKKLIMLFLAVNEFMRGFTISYLTFVTLKHLFFRKTKSQTEDGEGGNSSGQRCSVSFGENIETKQPNKYWSN